jgi:uncharacterized protein with PIN domain
VAIKFYANENLSADLVKALRPLGYDVLTSYEAGNANQGISDDQVLQTATAENRSVITFNRDDFLALYRSGVEHSGIVVCKDDSNIREIGQSKSWYRTSPAFTGFRWMYRDRFSRYASASP